MLCASLVLNRCPRVWGVCRSLYQLRSPQWPFRPTCTRLTECAPKLDMVSADVARFGWYSGQTEVF